MPMLGCEWKFSSVNSLRGSLLVQQGPTAPTKVNLIVYVLCVYICSSQQHVCVICLYFILRIKHWVHHFWLVYNNKSYIKYTFDCSVLQVAISRLGSVDWYFNFMIVVLQRTRRLYLLSTCVVIKSFIHIESPLCWFDWVTWDWSRLLFTEWLKLIALFVTENKLLKSSSFQYKCLTWIDLFLWDSISLIDCLSKFLLSVLGSEDILKNLEILFLCY